jgi:uncharacterized protein
MRFLIDIGHPADFLLFKEFTLSVQKEGHKVIFTTRKKDVVVDLISNYGLNFNCFGKSYTSIIGKIFGVFKFDFQLLFTSLFFKPDIFLSAGSIYASHVSFILRKPHIVCEDTGNEEQVKLYEPFTTTILTSSSFKKKLGAKQIFYDGCHELAYLHPKYFHPQNDKISTLFSKENKSYIILRFVSWKASHDRGLKGFTNEEKNLLVKELSKYARVYISSEQELTKELERYKLPIDPSELHNAIAFSSLVIGEGATVAAEAAVMGIPSIYVNPQSLGYLEEMERYGLVFTFSQFSQEILKKAISLIMNDESLIKLKENHERFLSDKIDVSGFLIWFLKNYPDSLRIMKENPDYQDNFK